MAILYLSLTDDFSIEFRRGSGTSPQEWFSICVWWGNAEAMSKAEFRVSIFDFLQKKSWLSNNWLNKGNELEYPPELTLRLQQIGGTIDAFENLSANILPASGQIEVETILKRSLKPRQRANVLRLLQMKNGANFSVPGSGKTAMELVLFRELIQKGVLERVLVIAPRSAWTSWQTEGPILFDDLPRIDIFDGNLELGVDGLVTNFEQLENPRRLKVLKTFVNSRKTLVVVDEAHRVKGGPPSVRWKAVSALVEGATRVDILTGTPMPQGFGDLRNLFGLTWPSLPKTYLSDLKLRSLVRDTVFVRTTKKELDLPPILSKTVIKPMDDIQESIYSALARKYNGLFRAQIATQDILAKRGKAVMSLIACATNPALLTRNSLFSESFDFEWPPRELGQDDELQDILRRYPLHEIPWKFTWVSKYVSQMATERKKVLVWTNFVGNIEALKKVLEPLNPAVIYGATPHIEREEEIQRFKMSEDCHVLISNPQTLGEGISLHDVCHNAVYVDRSYNAGQYLQSIDRIHRLGLDQDVVTNVYFLKSKSSIDLRIEARLAQKIRSMADFLDDPSLAESSIPYPIDEESAELLLAIENVELDDIFEHLSGRL
jgi:SNF2 family DNA or RNA helicase